MKAYNADKLDLDAQPTQIAAKLGIHPSYVNRRAEDISHRILKGIESHS